MGCLIIVLNVSVLCFGLGWFFNILVCEWVVI